MESKLNRDDLIYKTGSKKKDKKYDFQKFKKIRSFGREIYNNDLSLDDAPEQEIRLKNIIDICKESTKPKESVRKEKKALNLKNRIILLNGRQKIINAFESGIFPKGKQGKALTSILDHAARVPKVSDREGSDHKQLKILTPK